MVAVNICLSEDDISYRITLELLIKLIIIEVCQLVSAVTMTATVC